MIGKIRKVIAVATVSALMLTFTPTSQVKAADTSNLYVDVFIPRNLAHYFSEGDYSPYDPDGRLKKYFTETHGEDYAKKYSYQKEVDSDYPDQANYYWIGDTVGSNGLTLDEAKKKYKVYEYKVCEKTNNGKKGNGKYGTYDPFIEDMIEDGVSCYTISLEEWNIIKDIFDDLDSMTTEQWLNTYQNEKYFWLIDYYQGLAQPKRQYYQDSMGDFTSWPDDPNGHHFIHTYLSYYDWEIVGRDAGYTGSQLGAAGHYLLCSPEYMDINDGEFPGYTAGQVQPLNNYFAPAYECQDLFYRDEITPKLLSEPYTGSKHYQTDDLETYWYQYFNYTSTDDGTNNNVTPNTNDNTVNNDYSNGNVNNPTDNNRNNDNNNQYDDSNQNNTAVDNKKDTSKSTTTKKVSVAKVGSVKVKNQKGKKIVITFKKASNAKKYQIQVSTDKKFKKSVKTYTTNKVKYTVKKLKKKKTYYVRIRGINGSNTGKWSAVKKIKIKK